MFEYNFILIFLIVYLLPLHISIKTYTSNYGFILTTCIFYNFMLTFFNYLFTSIAHYIKTYASKIIDLDDNQLQSC